MADAADAPVPSKPAFEGVQAVDDPAGKTYVGLTYDKLDVTAAIDRVRSPKAGAVVVFIGKPITTLEYTTYAPLALRSLSSIVATLKSANQSTLHALAVVHRLGIVPIGEDSVVIALSTSHRAEAWRIAEECLELVKDKVEIWKREWFVDGGIWRANRDGAKGEALAGGSSEEPVPPEVLEQADR
ncbi:hypothetical protein Dda_0485 [Drechslerella dactyloides]|uniref:Uncharacterized protein n=1 Tax=Drechslerella dactyloides TaxID=74499 RepID=A0AAD6NNH1_DREDA|nr:hypothetical protein Dda_0485 [Drechslerella dactyloides]